MTRPFAFLGTLATGLLLAQPAYALDPWMWGVGPKIGTNVLPGEFPTGNTFPKAVKDDPAGLQLAGARFDFDFGVEATYYVNGSTRLDLAPDFDFGKGFDREEILIKYNYVVGSDAADFLVGGGIGAGTMRWVAPTTATGATDPAKLRVNTFPLRLESGLLVRNGFQGYQAVIYGQYDIPSRSVYTDTTGTASNVGFGFYLQMGVELAVMFGDFEPPRRHHPPNGGPG